MVSIEVFNIQNQGNVFRNTDLNFLSDDASLIHKRSRLKTFVIESGTDFLKSWDGEKDVSSHCFETA
jgi:hypothetical protein